MADGHDDGDGLGDDGGGGTSVWGQVPNWLKVLAAVIGGTAALVAAVPQLLTALRGTTPAGAHTPGPSPDETRYIVVQTSDHFLALRGLPSASSNLIIKMPQGSVVKCRGPLEDHPSWRTCSFEGRDGYANTLYLRKLDG